MQSKDILRNFITHYADRGHSEIPNLSLIPENDPTLLFVNSGMFPLVPYLSGEPHPAGKRLTNVQRSMRFEDLDKVGRTIRHTTAFHMLGNWSLGDYFKQEQLSWVFELYIDKLKLDPQRLFATVFAGDAYAPRDDESISILKAVFKKYGIDAKEEERIFACGKEDNWWQRGNAPGELGGPDSEVFYYLGEGTGVGKHPTDHQDEFLEIGNSVFMQYRKTHMGGWEELPQKNVDYGGGLERLALVAQGKKDIYETDNFWPIIEEMQDLLDVQYGTNEDITRAMRVIADHMRASVFLAMDGVVPSNKDQGYVLRRLIRRMTRFARKFEMKNTQHISSRLVPVTISSFGWLYPDLVTREKEITTLITEEENKFAYVLEKGKKQVDHALKKIQKSIPPSPVPSSLIDTIADSAFNQYETHGYPLDIFFEDLREALPDIVKLEDFEKVYKKETEKRMERHQSQSRQGAERKFKGGLADHGEQTTKYHTATHLLHQALFDVLGEEVRQEGSNITSERLRFDFTASHKLTSEEIERIHSIIQEIIDNALPVQYIIMEKDKALNLGAKAFFGEKYPDTVKVYFIGDTIENAHSKELCGGPHVANTKDIGSLTIYKVEKIGNNKFRIYAR